MKRNSSKTSPKRGLGGFTLVELVVVIAVLAILAGVGAVAYNGYIEYAKKGVDRKTVGEINHALELADYSNADLFSNGTVVYLTDTGLVCGNQDVLSSLEDALGDLNAVKLSYSWPNAMNAERLKAIADTLGVDANSSISKYWQNGGTASFAGNINELWDGVHGLLQDYGGFLNESGYLDRVVTNASDHKDDILTAWETPETAVDSLVSSNPGAEYLAVVVAMNCSFKQYAEARTDLTQTMREKLDAFNPIPKGRETPTYFYTVFGTDAEWSTVLSEYKTQAETDALAYLGLMEAASAIKGQIAPDGTAPTDQEFYDALSGYVGMTESVMESQENWNKAKEALTDSKTAVYATVTKSNDRLDIHWFPDDVDPREDAGNGEPGAKTCTKTHNTSVTLKPSKVNGETTWEGIGTIDLCTIDGPTSGTVSLTPGTGINNVLNNTFELISGDDVVSIKPNGNKQSCAITILGKSGTAVLKITLRNNGGTTEVTIHVH